MYRIYTVKINGRTLESRDLKELLARAVSAKRDPNKNKMMRAPLCGEISTAGSAGAYGDTGMAVVH